MIIIKERGVYLDKQVIKLREHLRTIIRCLGVLEKSDSQGSGITIAQCHAIVEIGHAGKISLNPLAEILMVEKSTMSRMIQSLVNEAIVERNIDPGNKRSVIIQLSEKGHKLFCSIESEMRQYYNDIYRDIPSGKRKQVVESLELLSNAINQQNKERQ